MQALTTIGFNLLNQVPRFAGGIETYSRELIAALRVERPDLRMVGFVNAEMYETTSSDPWPEGLRLVRAPVRPNQSVRRLLAEQLLGRKARRLGVDILHSLGTSGPIFTPMPHVVTLHDLTWMHFPDTIPSRGTLTLNFLVPRIARHATRLIADSEGAKQDICKLLEIEGGKVDVVHLGHGSIAGEQITPEAVLRGQWDLGGGPIVLYVSSKRAHKNQLRLIEAFATVDRSPKPILVLPGSSHPPYEHALKTRANELGITDRVRLLGWVDTPDLEGLFRAARCFVFPSLIEGFGMPVVEAMLRGLPVACSSAAPLPEVAGDAANYFDPFNTAEISTAINLLLEDEKERARLIEAGRRRAAQFTWERAAVKTMAVYDQVLT